MSEISKYKGRPLGLIPKDTIEDVIVRANSLSKPDSYSGLMVHNKDLRRIVLLTHEYCKLKRHNTELLLILQEYLTHGSSDGKQPIRTELRNRIKELI